MPEPVSSVRFSEARFFRYANVVKHHSVGLKSSIVLAIVAATPSMLRRKNVSR